MSGPELPHASHIFEYLQANDLSNNNIGPLGKRAGLDLEELYPNVVQLDFYPDAFAYANAGEGTSFC